MSKKRKTASVTPIFFDFKMVGRTNLHLVKIVEDFTEATWTELESKTNYQITASEHLPCGVLAQEFKLPCKY